VTPRHTHDADADLVGRCLADDADAWRELMIRHRSGMIDLARRILPDAAASDVVDDVIADLWQRRKLARFEGRSSLRTWLGAVVINASLNARRAAQSRPESEAAGDASDHTTEGIASDRDLAEVLHGAIASLRPALKTLVLLYYEQGLSLDEIGGLIGASKSTVSRSLQRARDEIAAAADGLARQRGTTLVSLRQGVDLSQLDLDVRAACSLERNTRGLSVSKP
jgi:RNA polymerase sigma-70 factor (ECF subfamily)